MKRAKIIVPVVTVLDKNEKLDFEGNKKVVEHLIGGGVDGILAMGSTGEFVSFTKEEKKAFIDFYIETVAGRIPVFVGTGTMELAETVELSNYAIQKGAAGVYVIVPYYFTIDDEMIYDYYDRLAAQVQGDVYIYNYPARTVNVVNAEVTARLLERHDNIKGYKDSSGDIRHTRSIILATKDKFPEFDVFSGFDADFIDNVLIGGAGCIGALSNIRPDVWSAFVKAYNSGDMSGIIENNEKIVKLMKIYDVKKNFISIVKAALNINGLGINEYCKYPLALATDAEKKTTIEILDSIK